MKQHPPGGPYDGRRCDSLGCPCWQSEHLREFNVGYFAHMIGAFGFACRSLAWTGQVFIHAFCPDLFTDTADEMKAEIEELEKYRA